MTDTIQMLPTLIKEIRDAHDPHIIIAITHLLTEDDIMLANELLDVDLIMGADENDNFYALRGPQLTPITKADVDGRSVYAHRIHLFDPDISNDSLREKFPFMSTIIRRSDVTLIVDQQVYFSHLTNYSDEEMAERVEEWSKKAHHVLKRSGYELDRPIYEMKQAWNLRRGNLAMSTSTPGERQLLTNAFVWCGHQFGLSVDANISLTTNSIIAIDALIKPQPLYVRDMFRIFPSTDKVIHAKIKGSVLRSGAKFTLSRSEHQLRYAGTSLLWSDALHCSSTSTFECEINGVLLRDEETYDVFITSSLTKGSYKGLETFRMDGSNVIIQESSEDNGVPVQKCMVQYLETQNPTLS